MAKQYIVTSSKENKTKLNEIITSNYSPTGEDAVDGKAIAAALDKLDYNDEAEDGKYVSSISEENGIITVTRAELPTIPGHTEDDIQKPATANEGQVLTFDGTNWIAKDPQVNEGADSDTTCTLVQDEEDGHKLIFTSSNSGPIEIIIPDNNTTYENATQLTAGLMSAEDKIKLDSFNNVLTLDEEGAIKLNSIILIDRTTNVEYTLGIDNGKLFIENIEEDIIEEPGLYDTDGNLLCTWEESGIKLQQSSYLPSKIIPSKYPNTAKIVIPEQSSEISIYSGTFDGCINLETVIFPNDNIANLPSGLFSSNFVKLKNIKLPQSITTLPDGFFYNCTSLTSVVIPDGVITIGSAAFSGCSNLQSVIIPNSVTTINGGAFQNCTSLTSVIIPSNTIYIAGGIFQNCTSLTSITIPDGVIVINNGTFSGCRNLQSVIIPNSVKQIDAAFMNCISLTSITIPDSVAVISGNAFSECTNLDVVIPNSVNTIKENAFYNVPHIEYHGTATGSPWGALSIN